MARAPQFPASTTPQAKDMDVAMFTHSIRTRANTIKFSHQSMCNPKISSLMKALQKGYLKGCPNLSEELVMKYLNPSPATAKGHMKPKKGIRSTQKQVKTKGDLNVLSIPVPMPQAAPHPLPLFIEPIPYNGPAWLPWPSGRLSALRNEGPGFETSTWQTFYTPLTDVCYFHSCVCQFTTHKPIMNLCTRFHAHGVGPSCFSIRDRYLIPAPPPHSCKVRWMAISDRQNALHNLARIVRTALSTRHCNEDFPGQVPRLWNCLQAAATESQPRYRE